MIETGCVPGIIGTILKLLIIFILNLVLCYCTVLIRLLREACPRPWHAGDFFTLSSFPQWLREQCLTLSAAQRLCHWRLSTILILLAVHEETKVDGLVLHSTWMAFVWWARFFVHVHQPVASPWRNLQSACPELWKMGFTWSKIFIQEGQHYQFDPLTPFHYSTGWGNCNQHDLPPSAQL